MIKHGIQFVKKKPQDFSHSLDCFEIIVGKCKENVFFSAEKEITLLPQHRSGAQSIS
jgi:hypothetical protein